MTETATGMPVTVTENCARRVSRLIEGEGDPGLMLRVSVSGGGCSGFQYGFALERETTDEDRLIEAHGITVVIDEVSMDLLQDATIDYVEDLIGASFRITNPQASATCGCGHSFSL